MLLNLVLEIEKHSIYYTRLTANQRFVARTTRGRQRLDQWLTYKIIPGAQSVCPLFLQQALQKRPGCGGGARAHHQGLVQDVVVHFVRVPAVERRLGTGKTHLCHPGRYESEVSQSN